MENILLHPDNLKLVKLEIIYQHGNSFSSVLDILRNPSKFGLGLSMG